MPFRRNRAFLWAAIALFFAVLGYALLAQYREANDTEIVAVALDPTDPGRTRVGELEYRGGIDIPRMGENIGGLSGLRWDAESGRLLAITDDARWVWMTPVEEEGQLVGVSDFEVGSLLGVDGEPLSGKEAGDSEALVKSPIDPPLHSAEDFDEFDWAVTFERDHRILVYSRGLENPPLRTDFDPEDELGELEDNAGLEAIAASDAHQLLCAERTSSTEQANCVLWRAEKDDYEPFPVSPPAELARYGGVPTDADVTEAGRYLVLFRSYSSSDGNTAGIVAYSPTRERRELVSLVPPLTLDNFEGLAVREEGGKTFLYIVSDDNFSSSQRTLLMKFELVGEGG